MRYMTTEDVMKLTKTDYLIYRDAPRHLWAYANKKVDNRKIDAFLLHLFDQGKEVQKLARQYIKQHLIPNTYKGEKRFNFEETKQDQDFEARIDLIVFDQGNNVWDLYEIKSSNSVKSEHIRDLAFQYLVFQKHYKIGKAYILHLNGDYTRSGKLSLGQLFTRTDITENIEKVLDEVHDERYQALDVLRTDNFEEAESCLKPKSCPCVDLCHFGLPKYPIYSIRYFSRGRARATFLEENYSKDILNVPSDSQLPRGQSFSPGQREQIDVAQSGKPLIKRDAITTHLDKLEYPLYFLDYESFNPAVPMFDGYAPYDQMPFQYSLHIQEDEGSELKHEEYIQTGKSDPSVQMLKSLSRVISDEGSVIVWSWFEQTQNNAMSKRYSDYKSLIDNVNSRIWDLMTPFHQQWYIHPDFKGSYSIKNVLPVLVPGFSYEGLAVQDGAEAMIRWVQMVHGGGITAQYLGLEGEGLVDVPEGGVDEGTKEELLEYCKMDTMAMVKLLEWLRTTVM